MHDQETSAMLPDACSRLASLLALAALRPDDDEASGGDGGDGDRTAAAARLSGRIEADGSSTVGPLTTRAAERFQQENPGVQITVGISGTGGGFERFCAGETDISERLARRSRTTRRPACEEKGVEYVEFQVANDALTVVVNKENDWATCLTDRAAEDDLGPRLDGLELEPGRPELPRRGARALRPGHRLGHVRLLHRRDQRRGGREPLRLHRERGRQRHRPGRRRREGRARLLRLLVLRGEPGHAEGARDRRRRRLRRAQRRDGAGRHLHPALAPALRLRRRSRRSSGPRCRRSSSTCSTTPRDRRGGAASCRSPTSRSEGEERSTTPRRRGTRDPIAGHQSARPARARSGGAGARTSIKAVLACARSSRS